MVLSQKCTEGNSMYAENVHSMHTTVYTATEISVGLVVYHFKQSQKCTKCLSIHTRNLHTMHGVRIHTT